MLESIVCILHLYIVEHSMNRIVFFCATIFIESTFPLSPPGDVVGKLTIGYQGWFTAINDGSPRGTMENPKKWVHWSRNVSTAPSAGNCKFDLYPDVRGYQQLYQTNLASLGNGGPANLFSSWSDQTVDYHFQLIQQNGIDTVALQVRFEHHRY